MADPIFRTILRLSKEAIMDMPAATEIEEFTIDALRAADQAYIYAKELWGAKDPRTEALLEAWCAIETAFKSCKEQS